MGFPRLKRTTLPDDIKTPHWTPELQAQLGKKIKAASDHGFSLGASNKAEKALKDAQSNGVSQGELANLRLKLIKERAEANRAWKAVVDKTAALDVTSFRRA